MFRTLFARPFGPRSFTELQLEEAKAAPLVLGVSSDERERLRLVLRASADFARRRRFLAGPVAVALGVS